MHYFPVRESGVHWPDYFPQDCPPQDSRPALGEVYRLINGALPNENDFKSYRQRGRKISAAPFGECQACGLSVYTDVEDVSRLKNRIPSQRKKVIVVGMLHPGLGKILPTPSHNEKSHHTWWVPEGCAPCDVFSIYPVS